MRRMGPRTLSEERRFNSAYFMVVLRIYFVLKGGSNGIDKQRRVLGGTTGTPCAKTRVNFERTYYASTDQVRSEYAAKGL